MYQDNIKVAGEKMDKTIAGIQKDLRLNRACWLSHPGKRA